MVRCFNGRREPEPWAAFLSQLLWVLVTLAHVRGCSIAPIQSEAAPEQVEALAWVHSPTLG